MALLDAGHPEVVVVGDELSVVEAIDMTVVVAEVLPAGDAVVVDRVVDDAVDPVETIVVVVVDGLVLALVIVLELGIVEVLVADDSVVLLLLSVVAIEVVLLESGHITLKPESLLSDAAPYGAGIPNFKYPFVPL
jgi:hypothetical protein